MKKIFDFIYGIIISVIIILLWIGLKMLGVVVSIVLTYVLLTMLALSIGIDFRHDLMIYTMLSFSLYSIWLVWVDRPALSKIVDISL